MSPEQRILELGIQLPAAKPPAGNYVPVIRTGNLHFTSGRAPQAVNGSPAKRRLGQEYSVEDGYALARSACIDLLAMKISTRFRPSSFSGKSTSTASAAVTRGPSSSWAAASIAATPMLTVRRCPEGDPARSCISDSICMRSRSATRPACAYEPHRMARTPFPIFSDGVARHDRDHYKVTLLSSDEIPGSFKGKNPTKESVWGLA